MEEVRFAVKAQSKYLYVFTWKSVAALLKLLFCERRFFEGGALKKS